MKKFNKKSLVLLICAALLLTVTVSGTVAYLVDNDGPVVNEFTPATADTDIEEEFDDTAKTSIVIINKGSVDVYVRVMVIGNYVDDETNQVVAPASIGITPLGSDWILGSDGYYYYKEVVKAADANSTDDETSNLLKNLTNGIAIDTTTHSGAHLEVTVIQQSIQADGQTASGTLPVVDAWKVTVDASGTITSAP